MEPKTESSTPLGCTIARQAYALTRYDAHSGTSTRATAAPRQREGTTRAMNHAYGTAMRMQSTVTSVAMSTVRTMMPR